MNLHRNTVSKELFQILKELMEENLLNDFRLVGGTNLSLRLNHRKSSDIDLFTDAEYGSLDYGLIENKLKETFEYYECLDHSGIVGFGRTYYIGHSKDGIIKLDLMYENDPFMHPTEYNDGIRMASLEEVAVMKIDAIFRGGRKKDFWDLHYLLFDLGMNIEDLISMHKTRCEYTHNREELINQLVNFEQADDEPDPLCNLGKFWDLVKMDIAHVVENLMPKQ